MKSKLANYFLIAFFSIFVTNTVLSLLNKCSNDSSVCIEQEEDSAEKETGEKGDAKKFSFSPNTMPFDDDICHGFHFNYYFITIKHLKFRSSDPSLLDVSMPNLFSPPKA
jgi:hypothetical protein